MIALVLGFVASADVVHPPDPCPPGAVGQSTHNGSFCVAATCGDTCEPGLECRPAGLCVKEVERDCGGDMPQPCTHLEGDRVCDTPADCPSDTTCVIADRCVPPPPPEPTATTTSLCGCTTSGTLPAFVVLFGLLPLAVRRRFVPETP